RGEGEEPEGGADAGKARAGVADHRGQAHGEEHGHEPADPRSETEEVPEETGRVGAHAEESAVAEGHEAEAAHERPRAADEGPDENLHDDVDEVLAHPAEGEEGLHGEEGDDEDGPEASPAHVRLAKMPPGRTNISTMKITKATTYPISADMSTPPTHL